MMRKAIVLCVMLAGILEAESWRGVYTINGTEGGGVITPTPDGGYVMASNSYALETAETYSWLIKLSSHGTIRWQRRWDWSGSMAPAVGPDGTIWIAQTVAKSTATRLLLFNEDGILLQASLLTLDRPGEDAWVNRLILFPEGFLLLGQFARTSFAIRIDPIGNVRWVKEFPLYSLEDASYFANGDILVVAHTYLMRISGDDGSVQSADWYSNSIGIGNVLLSARTFPDGTVIIAGTGDFGSWEGASWVAHLDGQGALKSYKAFDTLIADQAYIHPDGYAVIGYAGPYWSWGSTTLFAASPEAGLLWTSSHYRIGTLAMDLQKRPIFSGGYYFWPGEPEGPPTMVSFAGQLELDGTIPGCQYYDEKVEEREDLGLAVESESVTSTTVGVSSSPLVLNVSNAHGSADVCGTSVPHQRPLSRP